MTDSTNEPVRKASVWASTKRLVRILRSYRLRAVLSLLLIIPELIAGLLVPFYLGEVIDAAGSQRSMDLLTRQALLLIAVISVQALVTFTREFLMTALAERAMSDLRRRVYEHLLALPVGFFYRSQSGELQSAVSNDITQLRAALTTAPAYLVRGPFGLVGGVIMMVVISPTLTLVMLAAIPPVLVVAQLLGKKIQATSESAQAALATSMGAFQEGVGGIETVKTFGGEAREASRFGGLLETTYRLYKRRAAQEAGLASSVTFLVFGAIVGLFWLGGRMVITGTMTTGEMVAMLGYTMYVQGASGMLTQLWAQLQAALGASRRVFDLLDEPPEWEPAQSAVKAPIATGRIDFENVSFRYAADGEDVLSHINLTVPAGQVCGLVGASGSGKSTLGRLIFRFFQPTDGRVQVDGADLRDFSRGDLRQQLALVSQDPVLFTGTVRDNIRYGVPDASDADVEEAASQAYADHFIRELPGGYDTLVGERGLTLSGGQRQRIAIARALLRKPRLLVLDEATSALDSESEQYIQQALERVRVGRTTVVIAHRLSTVRHADLIVVLDKGKVLEMGTHDELLRNRAVYARLTDLQNAPRADHIESGASEAI